jgi:hypothetical protein
MSSEKNEQSLPRLVTLATLARQWDADRSAIRRILRVAGVEPVLLGRGRNASIRYRIDEIDAFLASREVRDSVTGASRGRSIGDAGGKAKSASVDAGQRQDHANALHSSAAALRAYGDGWVVQC